MIKKLLRENLVDYKNNFDLIHSIVFESFKGTNLIKEEKFLNESTSLLISNKED